MSQKITHMWGGWGTPQDFLLAFIDELWKTRKIKTFEKKKRKNLLEIFYTCEPKTTIIWGTVPEIQSESFWVIFCPFNPLPIPLTTQKTKILKKWKKHQEIHHFKLAQQKTWSYDVCLLRYGVWQTYFFVILGHFLLFCPTIDHEN